MRANDVHKFLITCQQMRHCYLLKPTQILYNTANLLFFHVESPLKFIALIHLYSIYIETR